MAKVLDSYFEVNEFVLKSRKYVYFETNTLGKVMKLFILFRYELSIITAILL